MTTLALLDGQPSISGVMHPAGTRCSAESV